MSYPTQPKPIAYPTHRNASGQAWRRLRKHLTDSELRDIAKDITAIIETEERADIEASVRHALASFPWETRRQV